MEEVDAFRQFEVDFAANERMNANFNHRSMEKRKCAGTVKSVRKNMNVSMETKRGLNEGIVVSIALYGSEALVLENKVKNRVDVAELSCLKRMCRKA